MKTNPSVLLAHSKRLELSATKYLITRMEVKALTIPRGDQEKALDNIFLGQLPKRVITGLVWNTAFNWDFKANPDIFNHYKTNVSLLYINGSQIH